MKNAPQLAVEMITARLGTHRKVEYVCVNRDFDPTWTFRVDGLEIKEARVDRKTLLEWRDARRSIEDIAEELTSLVVSNAPRVDAPRKRPLPETGGESLMDKTP